MQSRRDGADAPKAAARQRSRLAKAIGLSMAWCAMKELRFHPVPHATKRGQEVLKARRSSHAHSASSMKPASSWDKSSMGSGMSEATSIASPDSALGEFAFGDEHDDGILGEGIADVDLGLGELADAAREGAFGDGGGVFL